MKRFKKGFTLAEVLITLAIIGVVAAIAIPSVISNSQQQEFKTGLKKAVSVLNSAITMNIALDGESPYENADLFQYLQKHMSVMRSTSILPWSSQFVAWDNTYYKGYNNGAFYTTDGMRFEFDDTRHVGQTENNLKLHESDQHACFATISTFSSATGKPSDYYTPCGGCGSYGLNYNPNGTTKPPCAILVDVNGDRKPTPQKVANSSNAEDKSELEIQNYWIPTLESNRVSDIFVILITEDRAIPYGIVAQKAMYQAQK